MKKDPPLKKKHSYFGFAEDYIVSRFKAGFSKLLGMLDICINHILRNS